jgi:SOS response regulatory protein OraA/RecX
MFPDLDDVQERLSSWRRVAGLDEPPKRSPGSGEPDELFGDQLARYHRLCIQAVQARDAFYAELKVYVAKPGRDPQHQQQVEEEAAFVLDSFSQGSAYFLRRAIDRLNETNPRNHPRLHE